VSQRFPVRNAKEVVKVLRKHGFELVGNPAATRNGVMQTDGMVIVAMHGSKPIPIGTLKSIVEGSGLDVKDFR
jgi:predicted RNA binding protein YcfA (HicA-like mRNA interferase family)